MVSTFQAVLDELVAAITETVRTGDAPLPERRRAGRRAIEWVAAA